MIILIKINSYSKDFENKYISYINYKMNVAKKNNLLPVNIRKIVFEFKTGIAIRPDGRT